MQKLFVLSLSFLASFAVACNQPEAQFIGSVKHFKKEAIDQYIVECTYEIEFSVFNPSFVCPLVPGEVSGYRFEDTSCQLKNGDQVSGVLVRKGDTVTIE